eukprot:951383_1
MFTRPQHIFRRVPHVCIVPFGRRPMSGFGVEFVVNGIVNLFSGFVTKRLSGINYQKYIPYGISIRRRQFNHSPFNIQTRDIDGGLFTVYDQGRFFDDAYKDNDTEGADRTGTIVFIGKKKKGKSFNASMTSFIATTNPCHFAIGNKDHHNTIGLDISPPLNVYSREPMEKRRLVKLCVIDIEGFEQRDDTMKIMKNIIKVDNEMQCKRCHIRTRLNLCHTRSLPDMLRCGIQFQKSWKVLSVR